MLIINFQYKSFLLFSLQFLLFSSLVFLSKPSKAINEDKILKFKHAYPTEDEYIYLPRFCVLKIKELKLRGEGQRLPPNLARERERVVSFWVAPTLFFSVILCAFSVGLCGTQLHPYSYAVSYIASTFSPGLTACMLWQGPRI